ncbi:alpha/beta hydrolase [Paenibacillus pini]|uniref:Esterase n=1 Tax=Paenibacillus pini JCM 16418 TaxID=1236976 RepID=W7YFA2_9BACL|nr:alpha/beta hydrolase family protein [Paenibacillus pini]GAF09600.1 esterase [Paenibacillus pini JCM 16418]
MALIECRFNSEILGLNTSMTVILPERSHSIGLNSSSFNGSHPTLFLLHGLTDDDSGWVRRTSIERYAAALGIAVVMPQAHHSFYTDMAYGNRYWTFISEELPQIARSFFPLSHAREDNFVAGLSMGGYGAMKLALRKPEHFIAAASLSGALHMSNAAFKEDWKRTPFRYDLVFGDQDITGTDQDLLWLLKQCDQADGPKPMLYQCCGTEDFLYEDNQEFRKICAETNLQLTYVESPGGHDWTYWDAKIQDVLNWLPLRKS